MGQGDILEFFRGREGYYSAKEISQEIGINVQRVRTNIGRLLRWGEKTGKPIFDVKRKAFCYKRKDGELGANKVYCFVYKLLQGGGKGVNPPPE